jgi:hypothetical protein
MFEDKIYIKVVEEHYKEKYPIEIVEMMESLSLFPVLKKDGIPKLNKQGEEIYKTSWKMSPNFDPIQYPNEGTYTYYFVNKFTKEIVNIGETQNANSRPNNYNCVSFDKNGKPLGQKSNGTTNIGKNILMVKGLKAGNDYKLMLVKFGECVNQFGYRMIAPSQEKTMAMLYTKATGKKKTLWNGNLKELVQEYYDVMEYGQK